MTWWIFHIPPAYIWKSWRGFWNYFKFWNDGWRGWKPYVFTNLPRVAPKGRWGIGWGGFEIGSRSPNDCFGQHLKRIGLWPW